MRAAGEPTSGPLRGQRGIGTTAGALPREQEGIPRGAAGSGFGCLPLTRSFSLTETRGGDHAAVRRLRETSERSGRGRRPCVSSLCQCAGEGTSELCCPPWQGLRQKEGWPFPQLCPVFPQFLPPPCSGAARPPASRERNEAGDLQRELRGAGRAPVAAARPYPRAQLPGSASPGCGVGWLEEPLQSPRSSLPPQGTFRVLLGWLGTFPCPLSEDAISGLCSPWSQRSCSACWWQLR